MVTGYWHNFCNGSKNLKLKDVPSYYNMICVAFTGNTATPGEVTFEVDPDLARAVGGYTKNEFIRDIKTLKGKGQHVIISVGGAEGRITINSNTAADKFASTLSKIIKEYGFEGVDIDLEGSAVSGTAYIARGLRKVQKEFGNDFIITMAPETYYMHKAEGLTGAYYKLATEIKDILTIVYPQFYNAGGDIGYNNFNARYPSQSFITSLATMYIENGLRPDQLAIGVPSMASAAGSGYISTDSLKSVVNSLIYKKQLDGFTPPRAYDTLRGVMTWSINWDATQNYAWGKAMAELMKSLGEGGAEIPDDHTDDDDDDDDDDDEDEDDDDEDDDWDDDDDDDDDHDDDDDDDDDWDGDDDDDNKTDDNKTDDNQHGSGRIPAWDSSKVYWGGDQVVYNGKIYKAGWWTQGENPENCGEWGVWKLVGKA